MKKTIATLTLALVMTFGATFANAGILISDATATPCTQTETKNDGIIIFGKTGIIIFGFVIVGEKEKPCADTSKGGIVVSDIANTGILISD